ALTWSCWSLRGGSSCCQYSPGGSTGAARRAAAHRPPHPGPAEMGWVGYFLFLLPVAAVAYILWSYRRKTAHKEALSRERLVTRVGAGEGARATSAAAPGPQAAAAPAAAQPSATQPAAGSPAPAAQAPSRRERFLTQPETLLYYVLRSGLPDHQVFPHVSLS